MRKQLRLAVFAVVLAACARESGGGGLTQARFIEVVVELRRAALSAGDPASFESRKQQIFAETGVTEAELRAYIERHASDFDHMAATWDSINTRVSDAEPM